MADNKKQKGLFLQQPPNTDPTKGFVAPPTNKKPAVQRTPEYVKEFFDPSKSETEINLNLGGPVGTKPIWVTKSKLKKIRPIRSRHYEDMADGYFTVKRDLSDPLRDKVDYQIPKDAGSYSTVTSIKDIDLPIGAAQLFARMVAEEKGSSSKSSRSRDSYEDDLMFFMAKLEDDYPEIPQTRENAERLLWKLPLLKQPPPSQPTRKGLILGD